jgi:hypothetical protein
MDHEEMHNFFHHISRFTIILPIIIIALGIILKQDQPKNLSYSTYKPPTFTPTPLITATPTTTKPHGTPVDLEGPTVCTVTDEGAYTGTLYIKNKVIYGDIHEQTDRNISVLLQGDCVYKWDTTKKSGDKVCGITKYMSVLEALSKVNVLTAENVMNILAQYNNSSIDTKNVKAVCKKESFSNTLLQLPPNIIFQLKSIPKISSTQ